MRPNLQQQECGESSVSLYEKVTDRIVHELESGTVPWVKPWASSGVALGLPRSAATRRNYSGINILILWNAVIKRGFASQEWLTFRQALSIGGHVRKGEHGT
ncbi:MAG TPA: ArdC family protein, partial [Rhizomicrobium sp.]